MSKANKYETAGYMHSLHISPFFMVSISFLLVFFVKEKKQKMKILICKRDFIDYDGTQLLTNNHEYILSNTHIKEFVNVKTDTGDILPFFLSTINVWFYTNIELRKIKLKQINNEN